MGLREEHEEQFVKWFTDQHLGGGYGRLMQIGQKLWRDHLLKIGTPTGGEFSIGPCVAMLVDCQCAEEVEPELDSNGHCEWCCGTKKVTERVRRVSARVVPPDLARRTLDGAATAFHRIAMAIQGRGLVAKGVTNKILRESIEKQSLTDAEIASLCGDWFEGIVRALQKLGAPDISIHECNPSKEP